MRTLTFVSLSSLLLFGLGFSTLKMADNQSTAQVVQAGHSKTLVSQDRSRRSYRGSGRRVIMASSSSFISPVNAPKA